MKTGVMVLGLLVVGVMGAVGAEEGGHEHGDVGGVCPHGGVMLEFVHEACVGELVVEASSGMVTVHLYDGQMQPKGFECGPMSLVRTDGQRMMVALKPVANPEGVTEGVARLEGQADGLKGCREFAGKLITKIDGKAYSKPIKWLACGHDHDEGHEDEQDHEHGATRSHGHQH